MYPTAFHGDPRVMTVMIEVNRSLYLNEQDASKSSGFASTANAVQAVLSDLAVELARNR
jgi:N-formylglutamate amidohydrolase